MPHTYYHTYHKQSYNLFRRPSRTDESNMGIYLQKRQDGTTYGSLVIDRIISGKRLKLSTGSKDKKTVRKMNDLIDTLIDRGMDSHLRNLINKKVTIRYLYDLDLKGQLNNPFHDPELIQPLIPTLNDWTSSYKDWSDKTRQTNREFLDTMFRKLEGKIHNPTIEDTPKVLRLYRDLCEKNDHPRVFNLVRSSIQRFVRMRFGKSSTLFTQISDVQKLADRPKNPQTSKTPGQIEKLTRSLPEKYRGMVWTMVTTGVGWDEYGKLTPRDDMKNPRIYIEGTKMDKSDKRRRREVPLVYSPTPRLGSERQFRKVLKTSSTKLKMENVRVYTFRKCYSNWLVESGVPQWRVEMYMGHLPQSQTQKYQTTEVYQWLKEDGERLRQWIDQERKKIGSKPSDSLPSKTSPKGSRKGSTPP